MIFSSILTPALAVNKINPSQSQVFNPDGKHKLPPVTLELVEEVEKKGQRALIFSAIGLGLVIATVALISIGTLGATLPLSILGLAALFGNIGFVKAMRLRARTKSRKKTFAKARKRAKIALILSCVLGITLVLGLLHLLMEKGLTA